MLLELYTVPEALGLLDSVSENKVHALPTPFCILKIWYAT